MTSRSTFTNIALTLSMLMFAFGAWAQQATAPAPATATASQAVVDADDFDSRTTREELNEILSRHPEDVGVMLKLDPSLFTNDEWIASYPALREFVQKHPEVPLNASYYLARVYVPGNREPEPPAVRMANNIVEGVSIFSVMLVFIGALVWLIRTLLEHRRWSRVSRVQTEIYNKLLDRFTSHEDLLKYVQSVNGKDFIQSAISPIGTGTAPSIAAPISRILWSLQVGVILFCIGVGVWLVSGSLHPDVAASFSTIGVLGICAGLGFAASALVAWVVSRKLGILPVDSGESETGLLRERTLGE